MQFYKLKYKQDILYLRRGESKDDPESPYVMLKVINELPHDDKIHTLTLICDSYVGKFIPVIYKGLYVIGFRVDKTVINEVNTFTSYTIMNGDKVV